MFVIFNKFSSAKSVVVFSVTIAMSGNFLCKSIFEFQAFNSILTRSFSGYVKYESMDSHKVSYSDLDSNIQILIGF